MNWEQNAVATAFLSRFLEDQNNGAVQALNEYQKRYPGFEDLIAREFETVHPAGRSHSDDGETRPDRAFEAWRSLGDDDRYRRTGEVAHGGMARILEIWDRRLHRRAAMKVLLSGATAHRRLLDEALVTGQLEHPGIVPIHDLGIDEAGRPFFTMPLVRGQSFAEVIECTHRGDTPWSLTRALDVVMKVCEAVAFAHSRDVVHRDLKPANVMVGQFGEVYVLDWGLAHVDGGDCASSPAAAADATIEGDVLGTPAYMAPEQARGEVSRVGPESDVYAIGAMLYHLLTGRMPYLQAGERVPASVVLERAQSGPPAPVHTINKDVPAELVAICDKAMAREPSDRYADVQLLAADLRSYLEARVVRAYETGAIAQLRKWMLRNRALTTVAASATLALIAGLIFSIIQKERADTQAARAEVNLQTAFEAVDRLLTRVSEIHLADVPHLVPLRRQLLRDALQFQLKFLASREGDAAVREKVAFAYARVANIHLQLGELPQAEVAQTRARTIYESLASDFPERRELLHRIAGSDMALGCYHAARGDHRAALATYRSALANLQESHAAPSPAGGDSLEASLLNNLANALAALGEHEEALATSQRAVDLRARIAAARPDQLDDQVAAARQLGAHGHFLEQVKQSTAAEAAYRDAVAKMRSLEQRIGDKPEYRDNFRVVLNNLAALQLRDQRNEDAVETLLEAVTISRDLVRDYPSVPSYHGWLGAALTNLGQAHYGLRDRERARELFAQGMAEEKLAVASMPGHPLFTGFLRQQHDKYCIVSIQLGDHRAVAAAAADLAELQPSDATVAAAAARYLAKCVDLSLHDDALAIERRRAASEQYTARALEHLQRAVDLGLRDPSVLQHEWFDPLRAGVGYRRVAESLRAASRK